MKRARLVVNPRSGTDRGAQLLPVFRRRLAAIVDELDIVITSGEADAERAAADSLRGGWDALYVAGGDGTLNAALRGLVAGGGPALALPIGVIPVGTGNDFAKALGLGEDAETALDVLVRQQTLDVDLGMLNSRPFVNVSAGGFAADVSEAVTEELKDVTGKLAYLIGGARALLGSEPFSAVLSARGSGTQVSAGWSGLVRMFAVCNARLIGGGYPIAPAAAIDDGLLDVIVVPQMPVLEFVAVLQRIAAGEAYEAGSLLHFRAASFELRFDRRVRVNTDGEVLETDHCSYDVRPKSARFFCGDTPQTAGSM